MASSETRAVWLRIGMAFLIALIVTPVIAALLPETRWHRVATRTFIVTLALVFASQAGHPRTWSEKLRALGFRGTHRRHDLLVGFLVAVAAGTLLVVLERALGGRWAPTRTFKRTFIADVGLACLTAVLVSLFEEIMCRGYLKEKLGGVTSAALYAGVHYFRPMHRTSPADGYDPLLVIKRFPDLLEGFTVLNHVTFGLLSLFLLGLALNRLKDRTQSLYICFGVHAGIVLVLKISYRFLSGEASGSHMIWGSRRLHDGLLGTLMVAGLLWWAYKGPLFRKTGTDETPELRPT